MTARSRAGRGGAAATTSTRVRSRSATDEQRRDQLEGRASNPFLGLLAIVVILNLVGLVMVLSASSVDSLEEYGSSWYQFQRQLLWLAIGAVALFVTFKVDYRVWRRLAPVFLGVAVLLLVLVLVPGLGLEVNGASRWLGWGHARIQPSEIAKLALLVFVADLLARRAHRITESRLSFRPAVTVLAMVVGLVMLQPNLGTSVIIAVIVLVLMFVSGVPIKPLAALGAVGVGLAGIAAILEPYRFRRLLAFTDPWQDPLVTGYQTIQAQVGIANGGLMGAGLGEGRSKWGFLPEPHNDFIFAVIAEEMGLVGGLVLIGLFAAFGVLGVRAALRAPDRFGMLVAAGVTAWVLVQAFVNVGAVVGVLPITGVPLPFVSFGGSSLIILMAAAGLLLNVARNGREAPDPA